MLQLQINEKIFLQTLSARYAGDLYKITDNSREYLKEWLPWLDHIQSEEDSLTFIRNSLEAYIDFKEIVAGIFYEGNLVGIIGFNRIDQINKIASIGYWLSESMQGKGIVTQSVSAFIQYGFKHLAFNRMEIRVATENKRSRAIPERLGFTKEGIIREAEKLYGSYVDHVLYSMLAREWDEKK